MKTAYGGFELEDYYGIIFIVIADLIFIYFNPFWGIVSTLIVLGCIFAFVTFIAVYFKEPNHVYDQAKKERMDEIQTELKKVK